MDVNGCQSVYMALVIQVSGHVYKHMYIYIYVLHINMCVNK